MTTQTAPAAEPATAPTMPNPTETVLDLVGRTFDTYVTFPSPEAGDAVALWTLHAHVFRAFDTSPRLSIRSTEPGSGKSRVLELLEELTPHSLNAISLTPAVLWRLMDHGSPTILLDEADTVFGKNGSSSAYRSLRAILNAGHRQGATVPRAVGTEDVKRFNVFGPVALAGLGRLPDTISSRAVEVVMRPRRSTDPVIQPFRVATAGPVLTKIADLLASWSITATAQLIMSAAPDLPVTDRAADVWGPLVSIADLAGEGWGKRARRAARVLTEEASKRPANLGEQLLLDLRTIFGDEEVLFTDEILERLAAIDERDWSALTPKGLAKMLAEYGVASRSLRRDDRNAKGYQREWLVSVWDRHTSTP
jgi:Protein of unknown function (DUF3631)